MELACLIMAESEVGTIYSAENITIDQRKVVAGQTTFAIDSIQAVWVNRYSGTAST